MGLISSDLARSWLLVPAVSIAAINAAAAGGADVLLVDLEDGVVDSSKGQAREILSQWLRDGGSSWVRVSSQDSLHWHADMDALVALPGLLGVVLAKTEYPNQVAQTVRALRGQVAVVPLIESARGIESASSIAAERGVSRLAFGSGDYRRDTGVAADPLALAYPRSRLVVASRIANLPGPVDGPSLSLEPTELSADISLASSMGLTGKLCLDLNQVAAINEGLGPSRAEIEWAEQFLAGYESRGRTIRNGSDPPRLAAAMKIRDLAALFAGSAVSAISRDSS